MKSILTLVSVFIILITSAVLANIDDQQIETKLTNGGVPQALLTDSRQTQATGLKSSVAANRKGSVAIPLAPRVMGDPAEIPEIEACERGRLVNLLPSPMVWGNPDDFPGLLTEVGVTLKN